MAFSCLISGWILWFMVDITIVNGGFVMVYKPSYNWGGHPVYTWLLVVLFDPFCLLQRNNYLVSHHFPSKNPFQGEFENCIFFRYRKVNSVKSPHTPLFCLDILAKTIIFGCFGDSLLAMLPGSSRRLCHPIVIPPFWISYLPSGYLI